MANNRIFLTDTVTKDKILLAKYYPSAGWEFRATEASLQIFFAGCLQRTPFGGNPWGLSYEIEEEEERIYTEDVVKAIKLCLEAPMGVAHAEIPKKVLAQWLKALEKDDDDLRKYGTCT